MSAESVRRDPFGMPDLTRRQLDRVYRYTSDLWAKGTTTRTVDPALLVAAFVEIASALRCATLERTELLARLEQLAHERTRVVPVSHVAEMAVVLMATLTRLPSDAARTALLDSLRKDDTTFVVASPLGELGVLANVTKH